MIPHNEWEKELKERFFYNDWELFQGETIDDFKQFISTLIAQTRQDTVREVIEKIEEMFILEKKGVMEMMWGDKRKSFIRSHTNMDVGYNKAIEYITILLRSEYNIKDE